MTTEIPTHERIQQYTAGNLKNNLDGLVQHWTNDNNTMGIAMVNELLTKLANKLEPGKKFSGVIVPKYIAHVKEAPGKRIGKATVSGQALREGHHYKLILYDRFEDVQATSAQLHGVGQTKGVPDFIVGNEHKATLEQMLASNFDPHHMAQWQAERKELSEGAASLREDFDAIFDVISGHSGMGSTYRRMLLLGPVDVGSDASVLRALTDPHAFRNDLNWLEGNINDMPQHIRTAYFNFTSTITKASKEDSALLVAAVYQHKAEKSKGLIGQFREDAFMLEKLPDNHPVFEAVSAPDLDKAFKPVALYAGATLTDDKLSLRNKMRQEFITRAEALALMQAIPVYKAREAFNKMQADKYLGANFPQLLAEALRVTHDEAVRYADAKKRDSPYEPAMLKHEYKDVREAAALIDYAGNHLTTETQREALLRLLPMTRSERTLSSIYLVATKARHGKDQRTHYVPAGNFGIDTAAKIARIRSTPVGPTRGQALNQEAHAAGRQHMTVAQHVSLAALLDDGELVPQKLAAKNKDGITLLDALHATVQNALPVDDQTRQRVEYLHRLTTTLPVAYDGLRIDGALKQSMKPGFDIAKYVDARFLFKDQHDAIKKVYDKIESLRLHNLDLAGVGRQYEQALQTTIFRHHYYGQTLMLQKMGMPTVKHHGISHPLNLDSALAALSTPQDPMLFKKLMRVHPTERASLTLLAEGKAMATPSLLSDARQLYARHERGDAKIDPWCALRDPNPPLDSRHKLYQVHAEAEGEDPKGDVIRTFSKKHDGMPGLSFNGQNKRWEGRFSYTDLHEFLSSVVRSNVAKQRDVYIVIDGSK